ncbi:MAG TPA: trypsin-like peptidase domain-containing protein [Acidimicrobiales bacterium]|nr:trypsin-like peptidase domain-containing protein [Acidimicrobiales bacterium]
MDHDPTHPHDALTAVGEERSSTTRELGLPAWGVPQGPPPPAAPAAGGPGRSRWPAIALVAAVIGAVVGGVVGGVIGSNRANQKTVVESSSPGSGPFKNEQPLTIQSVLAKVMPAVVSIRTEMFNPGSFFSAGPIQGAGSGMIVTADGDVLTNNHVIAGATKITATISGQTQSHPASVVGTDPADDIALVHIQGVSGLPTVTLGNSAAERVGDSVVAIGNALDLSVSSPTVTQGIISAEGRTIQSSDSAGGTVETLTDMLQTDAAINPGNSGGPLVNAQGEVIGMNTAVASSAGATGETAQNIGFAIPTDKIKPILPKLRTGQSVAGSHAFIGVDVVDLTPDLKQSYGFTPDQGAVVAGVTAGSPAENAGLQVGDVITAFDGTAINSATDLTSALAEHKPGQQVTLTVYRGSQKLSVNVTLGSRPAAG